MTLWIHLWKPICSLNLPGSWCSCAVFCQDCFPSTPSTSSSPSSLLFYLVILFIFIRAQDQTRGLTYIRLNPLNSDFHFWILQTDWILSTFFLLILSNCFASKEKPLSDVSAKRHNKYIKSMPAPVTDAFHYPVCSVGCYNTNKTLSDWLCPWTRHLKNYCEHEHPLGMSQNSHYDENFRMISLVQSQIIKGPKLTWTFSSVWSPVAAECELKIALQSSNGVTSSHWPS